MVRKFLSDERRRFQNSQIISDALFKTAGRILALPRFQRALKPYSLILPNDMLSISCLYSGRRAFRPCRMLASLKWEVPQSAWHSSVIPFLQELVEAFYLCDESREYFWCRENHPGPVYQSMNVSHGHQRFGRWPLHLGELSSVLCYGMNLCVDDLPVNFRFRKLSGTQRGSAQVTAEAWGSEWWTEHGTRLPTNNNIIRSSIHGA